VKNLYREEILKAMQHSPTKLSEQKNIFHFDNGQEKQLLRRPFKELRRVNELQRKK
jgi:hypothetical protein